LVKDIITGLGRDRLGNAFLHDADVRAAGHGTQDDGRHHHPRQAGIVEAVAVPDALEGHQFQVLPAEGMAVARGEVGEGHPVAAADARI
jgi:hypothetical protein